MPIKLIDAYQWQDATDENLALGAALSLDGVLVDSPPAFLGRPRDELAEEYARMRERVESHGLELSVLAMAEMPRRAIMYEEDGWEEQLAGWCEVVGAIGDAGVSRTGISGFSEVDYFRTTSRRGRGGVTYSSWDIDEHLASPRRNPDEEVAPEMAIDEPTLWRRLAVFLGALAPAAEAAGVRLGLHPDDPPVPATIAGVSRILTTVDSYSRVFELHPSPANGVLFCQGCFAEGGTDLGAAIRRFGPERIVYCHLRNIRGGPGNFDEVFIDEGDVDVVQTIRVLREVGFDGPVMMDHTPYIDHPVGEWAGRSFANGYLRAALQQVECEAT